MILEALDALDFVDSEGQKLHFSKGQRSEWPLVEGLRLIYMAPTCLKIVPGPAEEARGQGTTSSSMWELSWQTLLDDVQAFSTPRPTIIDENLLLCAMQFVMAEKAFIEGDFEAFLIHARQIRELRAVTGRSNI